jgi:hypothetical protein
MTGTSGTSTCTVASSPTGSGPGSSTSSTMRAGSPWRTASSAAMPSLTGLTLTPSARRLRTTEADAAVAGRASSTRSLTESWGGGKARETAGKAATGAIAPP